MQNNLRPKYMKRCKKRGWKWWGYTGGVGNGARFSRWSLGMVEKEVGDNKLQGCSWNLGWGSSLVHVSWESPVLSSSRQDAIPINNLVLQQLDGWLSRNVGKCANMASSLHLTWPLFSQMLGVGLEVGWGSLHIKGTRNKLLQGGISSLGREELPFYSP